MATIPFNLIFGLLVGLAFTACARTQLLSGAQPFRRELSLVVSFALLTVAPVAAYLYFWYPEWSWMYLVEPGRLKKGTGLAVVVLTVLMVPAGYLIGWLLLRVRVREGGLWAILALLFSCLLLVVGLGHRRLFVLGRYDDFATGLLPMKSITQGKLALALLCIWPAVLTSAVLVGWSLWGCGRWLRHQAASASLRTGEHSPISVTSPISSEGPRIKHRSQP